MQIPIRLTVITESNVHTNIDSLLQLDSIREIINKNNFFILHFKLFTKSLHYCTPMELPNGLSPIYEGGSRAQVKTDYPTTTLFSDLFPLLP